MGHENDLGCYISPIKFVQHFYQCGFREFLLSLEKIKSVDVRAFRKAVRNL